MVKAWLLAGAWVVATAQSAAIPAASGAPSRAAVVDRNGVALATSGEAPSLYGDPRRIGDPAVVATRLAALIPGSDVGRLRERLQSHRSFVWIARRVNRDVASAVMSAGLRGIHVRNEPIRLYPQGALTAHLVGFTDVDAHVGMAGAERWFDRTLSHGGPPLQLSVDVRMQSIVRDELSNSVRAFAAKGGAGLVLDARTSEVLALVSLPDFDPTDRATIDPNGYKDVLTANVYELGGLFEIFTVAIALDDHTATPATLLDVSKPLRLGRVTVHDDEPATQPLTVTQAFARSSMIGMALLAERSSPDAQLASLHRLGLLEAMYLTPDETLTKPLTHGYGWNSLDRTVIGYGYGIAMTPLQAAVVATAVVNRGALVPPALLVRSSATQTTGKPVVSEETSKQVRELLRNAVVDGTGASADVSGLEVGGKTGTSRALVAGAYDKARRLTWFFAGFPMGPEPPRYTVLVMLDQPQATESTRGLATAQWNAVPTAGRIIARLAQLSGVVEPRRLLQIPDLEPCCLAPTKQTPSASLHR